MINDEKISTRGFYLVSEKEIESKYGEFNNLSFTKPKRADKGSAGYDFYSPIETVIYPKSKKLIWTGYKIKLPVDNVLLLDTRSGNGTKKDIVLANTIGVIDSSYYNNISNEGHIGICLKNDGNEPFYIKKDDKIAQGIITNYFITDEDDFFNDSNAKERTGGFGSSGS